MAKKSTTTKPRKAANKLDAKVDAGKRDAGMNVQSGMDPGPPSDVRAQQVRDQFANADELAAPNEEQRRALEEQRVGQQVRGY